MDVFFVISGFLITTLIAKGIETGTFSFGAFYYRRAKRLLPPAYVVLLLTAIAAPFFIAAVEMEEFKAQLVGALTFTANIALWLQSGYFDGAAGSKPLLHFWSLAIEEQYYFVMPLLLALVPRRFWVPVVAVVVAISAAACFWFAYRDPSFAFYMPFTRIWELGIGSLGALVMVPVGRWLSLARIPAVIAIVAVPAFPTGLPHPTLDALIVCVATLVLIKGATGHSFERSIPVRGLAWVGDFSYSLYLVHWPVLVFTQAGYLGETPLTARLAAVGISLVLGYLLYLFVEEPFRRNFAGINSRRIAAIGLAAFVVGLAPFASSAVAPRDDRDFAHLLRQNLGIGRQCGFGEKYEWPGYVPEECKTKPGAKILTWGDSYARAWTTALLKPLSARGIQQATMARCDPLSYMARYSEGGAEAEQWDRAYTEECIRFIREVGAYIARSDEIEIVVLAGRFQSVLSPNTTILVDDGGITEHKPSVTLIAKGLARTVEMVRKAGKKVVVLAPPPADGSEIGACLERKARRTITFVELSTCDLSLREVRAYRKPVRNMLKRVARDADVDVIDLYNFFCDATTCKTEIDGIPLYRDSGHLSVDGARLVGERTNLGKRVLRAAR